MSRTSTWSLDASAAARALMLALGLVAFFVYAAGFAAMFGSASAIALTSLYALFILAAGGAGWMVFLATEVVEPPGTVRARWRTLNPFAELVVSGLGTMFLWMACLLPMTSAVFALEFGDGLFGALLGSVPLALTIGALGALLALYRPAVVWSAAHPAPRWHMLAPAIPAFTRLNPSTLSLSADRYPGQLGRPPGYILTLHSPRASFELEYLGGDPSVSAVDARMKAWSDRLAIPFRSRSEQERAMVAFLNARMSVG